jgi:transposase-like protein
MSTEKQRTRINYSEKFKNNAITLASNPKISIAQMTRELGIKKNTL